MARILEHREAIKLRKEGKSYSQIKRELGISKSTLSDWLHKYPLNKEQLRVLKNQNEIRIEKYRETMRLRREQRDLAYYNDQKIKWLPLSKREEFIAGLFLYWGEGNKANRSIVSINNTDPSVVKYCLYWITKNLNIPKNKVEVQLHLYSDMDVNNELSFWSNELGINKEQFAKPYIKENKKADIDQKGGFGHGTCGVLVGNTILKENILMAIKAISDEFNKKIGNLV